MKIRGRRKGLNVWQFVLSRCFGQLLSSPMGCYLRWLPELGSELFLGIKKRLYLTQRTASGPRPFFSSQTRKAASSSFLVRKSVSTGGCTVVFSSTPVRAARGAERRDFAVENSVFLSFEIVFLFTIARIHWGKLELIRFTRALWTHVREAPFSRQLPLHEIGKRPRPGVLRWTTGLSHGGRPARRGSRACRSRLCCLHHLGNRIQTRGQMGDQPPSSLACGLRTRRCILMPLIRHGSQLRAPPANGLLLCYLISALQIVPVYFPVW